MHALDPGGAGAAWQAIAASLPKPRAILMVSAHWETSLPMLSGREQLETIHDFGGFPAELYKVRYDAPGSPEVAQRATDLLRAAGHHARDQLVSRHRPRCVGAAQMDVSGERRARGASVGAAVARHGAPPAAG